MISKFSLYWKMKSRIVPGLKDSQEVFGDILKDKCAGAAWLDLGCGHQILPTWIREKEISLVNRSQLLVGLDYEMGSLKKHRTINRLVRGDIGKLPFADGSFDLVTSNMVFEHLDKPVSQIKEVARVLSKGGQLIFHTPNVRSYGTILARMVPEYLKDKIVFLMQERKEDDVFPAFYKINSFKDIESVAKSCGLRIVDIRMVCSSALFHKLPPLVFFELFWIKLLMKEPMKNHRPYFIVTFEK